MSAFFNLPFSIFLTRKTPVDSRFEVDTKTDILTNGAPFKGLGPIWVKDEEWYYYMDSDTTYKIWPTGSGASASGSDAYLFEDLTVSYYNEVSLSIDMTYESHFLLVENLIYKKDKDFSEVINGGNKYIAWNMSNGILEEDDNIVLVYKNL